MVNLEKECGTISKERETPYPKVAIIIPHFGHEPLSETAASNTKECLQAIFKITYPNYQVIIVDSGSQNGASYLFLINNDTIVAEETLSKLVKFAEQHPEIGAIGPKVYDYSKGVKSQLLQTIGGKFILRALVQRRKETLTSIKKGVEDGLKKRNQE